jgi:hypothetical protein
LPWAHLHATCIVDNTYCSWVTRLFLGRASISFFDTGSSSLRVDIEPLNVVQGFGLPLTANTSTHRTFDLLLSRINYRDLGDSSLWYLPFTQPTPVLRTASCLGLYPQTFPSTKRNFECRPTTESRPIYIWLCTDHDNLPRLFQRWMGMLNYKSNMFHTASRSRPTAANPILEKNAKGSGQSSPYTSLFTCRSRKGNNG